jgi:acetolactate synthase-1/2/3 large subunit
VSLARGFGVPGTRVETAAALAAALRRALAEPGPHLIEAVL